ncbi:MAG: peptidylprolyl isomerase [Eubacterium sp.]|nr:peptidylprolyl isomerase [Eubacterium sp.]
MNSAKKIMKNDGLGTMNPVKAKEENIVSHKNKILILIGLILIVGFSLVVCYIQLRPREILTVTGMNANNQEITNKLYFTDAMYDIYTAETQYNSYESLYQQIYGSSYWTAQNVDKAGRTGAQAAKKQVMDSLKQREILYMEALKNNMELTDEEQKTISDDVNGVMEQLTDKQKKISGLDEASIKETLEKQALADKYKQNVIAGLGIDEEALKKTVSKKDYRQYTLQYYTISKTETKSGESEATQKSAEDLKKAKEAMEALQKKAVKAEDFTKGLITDSDSDNTDDNTGISYSTENLIETDTDFMDEKTRKQVKAMKNNEVSGVMETKDAYFVVKMVNNNDPEAYDNQCNQVVSDEKEKQFEAKYKSEIKTAYTTEVQSYWRGRVNIGYLTADSNN